MEWNYEGEPTVNGIYAVKYNFGEPTGLGYMAMTWSSGKWDARWPVVGWSSKPFSTYKEAWEWIE
ncbi:MAG: hypothetical protein COA47_10350 [Robiginitomaculum sp.]|nr:MAG: hypothetical protein COA47_10350 [Robiginitomaculum sp.]